MLAYEDGPAAMDWLIWVFGFSAGRSQQLAHLLAGLVDLGRR